MNLCLSARLAPLALLTLTSTCASSASAAEVAPNLKVLLCTGDFGMWAQDRVPLITNAVEKAAPGRVSFESEQSYNFVKKLEAPGWAGRFDAIACGDIALGQMTPRAQAALVQFVQNGGGFIYVMHAKSTIPWRGVPGVVPMPLADALPFKYPDFNPIKDARADAIAHTPGSPLLQGLDFSNTPLLAAASASSTSTLAVAPAPSTSASILTPAPLLLLERKLGRGRIAALYGGFGPSYKYVSYAKHERVPGGWDDWPQLGEMWARVLSHSAQSSPSRAQSRAQTDALVRDQALQVEVAVDARRVVDEIRAANFSIVALQQLYNEDGGAGEDLFLALNPLDWMDRRTQEVLPNTKGKQSDKPAFFRAYNIGGIYMADNSYGSYGGWDEAKYAQQIALAVENARKYPDILRFFQPGNEPPLDEKYFAFHNRIAQGVLKDAPAYKIVGPNRHFNMGGVEEDGMKKFIAACGANTDILNWHTYAEPPEMVLAEAKYWSTFATGKMRGANAAGPARVMFTESDAWNTRASQFNYLLRRAFTFLPEPIIVANFQYCMRPRSEGGPYRFGVLQPEGEMAANYSGYWIWRNLRGRMISSSVRVPAQAAGASDNVHAIASLSRDGKQVTVVSYYDTGFYNSTAKLRAEKAVVQIAASLPPGRWSARLSRASWDSRREEAIEGVFSGQARVPVELATCEAASITWTRQEP